MSDTKWQPTARLRLQRLKQKAEAARLSSNLAADALTQAGLDLMSAEKRLTELQGAPIQQGAPVGLHERRIAEQQAEIQTLRQLRDEARTQAAESAAISQAASTLARSATEAFNKAAGIGSTTSIKG